MQKNFYNLNILNSVYYGDKSKLNTRINVWKNYGTEKQSYADFLLSIIGKQKFNGYADLGCGNAFYSNKFINNIVGNAYFCDISNDLLCEAQSNITPHDFCKVTFINDDIINAKIPDNSCELITLMHVLHHIDNLDTIFEKVKKISKKNSKILITTYNHSLTDFLNTTHYDALKKFGFPQYMIDTTEYLKFNGNNAYEYLIKSFNNVETFIYQNDAIIDDPSVLLDYYSSAMMFRMSKGYFSLDITSQQWEQLYNYVKENIEKEIEKKGAILLEGQLMAFLVNTNYDS